MEVSGVAPGPGPAGSARVDVIVPLKRLGEAKSRLAAASTALPAPAGGPAAHRALVLAMVRDTLAAARAARLVGRLVVVTAEEHLDLDGAGDAPEIVGDPAGGLNAALRAGAEHLRATSGPSGPPRAVAALQADLPALHAAELDDALGAALARLRPDGTAPAAFVADRQGTGTTLLVTAPGRTPRPRFGPGSAAAHRGTGAVDLDGGWPGLRADVDTPADLDRVRTLGCGPATRAWPALALACRS